MIDIAARIVLLPLLAWQGAKVRRDALHLPEAVGRRTGRCGHGPNLRLLIVGDSSAAGVGTSHQDEALLGHMRKRLSQTNCLDWSVVAKTGSTTAEMAARIAEAPTEKFDVVSVSLGVNDITGLVPRRIWRKQYADLLDLLEQKYQAQLICVSGIPQMQHFPILPNPLSWVLGGEAARFDRDLQNLVAERPKCRFVPMDFKTDASLMSEDGFHPGPKIYAEWGRKVYRAIRHDLLRISDAAKAEEAGKGAPAR